VQVRLEAVELHWTRSSGIPDEREDGDATRRSFDKPNRNAEAPPHGSALTLCVRVPAHDDHGFRRNVINQSSAS
jgi:hypothetical protein